MSANEPITTLDRLIGEAIDRARQQAIDQTTDRIIKTLGDEHGVRALVYGEIARLLKDDPEVKARLRASLLRMLDEPAPRRF